MEIARNKPIAKDKIMAQYSSGDNIPSRAGSSEGPKKKKQKKKKTEKLISAITKQEFVSLPNRSDPMPDNRAITPPSPSQPGVH